MQMSLAKFVINRGKYKLFMQKNSLFCLLKKFPYDILDPFFVQP